MKKRTMEPRDILISMAILFGLVYLDEKYDLDAGVKKAVVEALETMREGTSKLVKGQRK